jgi:choline dehydrogenase
VAQQFLRGPEPAVGTPHLLMLSGVGPAAESPGSLLRYLLRRRGMLTSNVAEAAAFARTNPQLEAPDLELIFAPVLYLDEGLAKPPRHGFSIGVVALQPASRGVIALRSADPFAMPVIQPQYPSDPADAEVMVHGVTLARHIVAARPFDALRGGELEPGPGAQHAEDIEAWIRSRAHTVYHPVGSCRLGLDELAVVDPELCVRGIERLRVADVSVLPSIVRGHTAAVATRSANARQTSCEAQDLSRRLLPPARPGLEEVIAHSSTKDTRRPV